MGIAADVDVRVLPRHGDHLVGPGDADMDADQLELREVAGHRVERYRPADAAQPLLGRVDERLADLHLHRDVELDALRIEGIPARVVRGELEPVRVHMGADEAVIAHRALERAHAGHPLGRIQAGQTRETPGMASHHFVHALVGQVPAAGQSEASGLRGDEEGALDARLVHQRQHLLLADAVDQRGIAADLLRPELL